MNRFAAVLIFCGVFLAAAIFARSVQAQESLPEEQITQIRQNCVKAQTVLRQLGVSESGVRTSRGSLYENISTKLMAPLNSRIVLNHLGGLKLAATTFEYDKQFASFQSSYRAYADSMSQTLAINCENQPMAFYSSVASTREKRQKLHDDVQALNVLLQTYKNDFEDFVKENSKGDK